MPASQWHKFYTSHAAAPPGVLFELLADMPNYGRWLPGSPQFAKTTDVEPYPVQLGSRYHDGKPDEPGKDWWVTAVVWWKSSDPGGWNPVTVPHQSLPGSSGFPS